MIAVDTNVLVHAHRQDSAHHGRALQAVRSLSVDRAPWAVPWPCVHEFLAVVTHPKLFDPPTPTREALQTVEDLFGLSGMQAIGETTDHLEVLRDLVAASRVVGPKVHDARIAAICLAHGVSQLWTADRDFSFFPSLRTHNPLVER
ncbi:hypothetical protein BH24ACT8_BH24ACT8_24450 [soil metagenome]|jgi:toxin-antitoxin system PIN domain toxin